MAQPSGTVQDVRTFYKYICMHSLYTFFVLFSARKLLDFGRNRDKWFARDAGLHSSYQGLRHLRRHRCGQCVSAWKMLYSPHDDNNHPAATSSLYHHHSGTKYRDIYLLPNTFPSMFTLFSSVLLHVWLRERLRLFWKPVLSLHSSR